MDEKLKIQILENAKKFFGETIIPNHVSNLKKLRKLSSFKYNPFLLNYLGIFMDGNTKPETLAKVLLYPRILGTSINTSFGNNLQKFCSQVLSGFASTTSGIDIEFEDKLDGRKKYCQIKAGPQTVNKDDVETISRHFVAVKNLARTNNLSISLEDLIVGVLYGTEDELSGNYKNINKEYSVIVGKEFWHHLTGDENFYADLIELFGTNALKVKGKTLIKKVLLDLTEDIKVHFTKEQLGK